MLEYMTTAYTADDLVWLPEALGGHVELDPWGNAVVSPVSVPHFIVVMNLLRTLVLALEGTGLGVGSEGPPWKVPGGSGYTNVPDLTVLRAPNVEHDEEHNLRLAWPPLLVVEVASPSTRAIDRGRKRDDYLLGGAEAYLLVDLPRRPGAVPLLELLVAEAGRWRTAASGPTLTLDLAGRTIPLDGAALLPPAA